MSKYQKTAKDKAWDREREKLKSEILQLRLEKKELENAIKILNVTEKSLREETAKLNEIIEKLSEKDAKVLVEQYESAQRFEEMFKFLIQGQKYFR